MRNLKRKCKICEKEIIAHQESIHRSHSDNTKKKHHTITISDEGVFFETISPHGVWFCNKCWEKLLK